MQPEIIFSILMPTFNSEWSLARTLSSIRDQDFDQQQLEIIIADGGSSDRTLEIAQQFNCVILDNKERLPEPGFFLALKAATGKYIIKMGSDEVFNEKDILTRRLQFFEHYPDVKCLFRNAFLTPDGCGIAALYANMFGDPFSYFIYRNKKDGIHTYDTKVIDRSKYGVKMSFSKSDLTPLADSGTTLSLDYIKEKWPKETWNMKFCTGTFENVTTSTGLCGCIPEDLIIHYGKYSLKYFLSKMRFRVINNVFHKDDSGFSVKENTVPLLVKRKKIFYLYALTVIGPVWDSFKLAILYKKPSLLLHCFYIYYVCFYAFYCYVLKILGKQKSNTSYGQ